ncbi:OmpA family protein [Salipiger sp. IMCC34102]|uniref:OmpA family protein n=1 Tax=Salipiger sp. IMCC34102 TaxID=2510647 RepID=UPI00101DA99D|nr:OmpA family protein [Salipiger sp. IMCC34102]RYH01968.1 OmpA family protein [Salipiger sp. IMCC34102]
MKTAALLLLTLWPAALSAQALSLPGNAERTLSRTVEQASYALPVGPWSEGAVPTRPLSGAQSVEVWQIPARALDPGVILASLRDQLLDQGFEVLLDCAATGCGGFDFRFAIPVEPPPDMLVDLGAYRFLSARKGEAAVSLLVSRTPQGGYVQITRIAPDPDALPGAAPDAPALRAPVPGDLATALEVSGHAILDGVDFQTGVTALTGEPIPSLQALAAYLDANPDLAVSIVGHTDAQGALEGNIALSRQRAGAVVERLVTGYGVPRAQLTAAGMGYLSPVASNLTDDGRTANRRVEAMVTGRR